ncbi:hypothetical protein RXV91_02480 [Lactiplantibacillus sp. DA1]|uniref:hypothetical protein n=1 Tax=Lactiplantibacillus sp. DA1 TaxID=3079857 RepID=UPI00292A66DA|nr:hypothetical protein [Lactiplantibacillus sp. DA1]MDV0429748.1 hypothetical protein [Lactiplantibacillus sp. DA1]
MKVTKNKDAWMVQAYFYTIDGDRQRKTKCFSKRQGITTKRQAQKAADVWVAKMEGQYAKGQKDSPTLQDFYTNYWCKTIGAKDTSSMERYKSTMEGQVLPMIGAKKLKQLTFKTLNDFFTKAARTKNKRTKKLLSRDALANYKKALSSVLRFAISQEFISHNYCRNINLDEICIKPTNQKELLKKKIGRTAYTEDEVKLLINHLNNDPSVTPWFRNFAIIMLGCGLRDEKMAALDFKYSVNFDEGYLLINKAMSATKKTPKLLKDTKNHQNRKVYFNDSVHKALKSQKELTRHLMAKHPDNFDWSMTPEDEKLVMVFSYGNGLPYRPNYLGKKWQETIKDYKDVPH